MGRLVVQNKETSRRLPSLLKGLLGRSEPRQQFAVNIPQVTLQRIGHIAPSPPDSLHLREEFRMIKRQVLARVQSGQGRAGCDPRVVVVMSAHPGEGKTFVSLYLALSLAIERGQNVTLLDGDVKDGGLSKLFGLGSEMGLVDALDDPTADPKSFVETSNVGNFGMMPVGYGHQDAVELLTGERMSSLIKTLLSESPNQLIVIDTPSILSGSAALALAAHAGQMVFVISSNESRRAEVEECFGILDASVGPIDSTNIGLVLNKISPAHSTARYSAN